MLTLHRTLRTSRTSRIFITAFILVAFTVLTGCLPASTPTKNARNVGPSPTEGNVPSLQVATVQKQYPYNSSVYLDVVIPVFDPGLPQDAQGNTDYNAIEKQGIWPQLRRAEATRFAVDTRKAMEKIGAFGAVSVVPGATATGDLYVLGSIDQSNSETIQLSVDVIDSQGTHWGQKQFTHQVSTGFFRDRNNEGKNPYEPVFQQIADYVYELLVKRSEKQKLTIKSVTDIRYAQSYAPEAFQQYLITTRNDDNVYQYQLVNTPSPNHPMSRRIEPLRLQSQLFIDRLQMHYDSFYARTDEGYRNWQKETLPEVVALQQTRQDRNNKIALGAALATIAVLLDRNSNSNAGAVGKAVSILGSGLLLSDAMNKNAELKVHKQTLDEMGESLDIQISPQIMKHNEQTIELTGTASEQYEQWRAHLQAIYKLEEYTENKI